MNVVHLTSVHSRYDTRIFNKECRSLAAHGYGVTLIVADDKGDEVKDGVRILDVGRRSGRIKRMLQTTRAVYEKAVVLDADIYHLHDPELIPAGLRLKRLGKKVIFDAHEDLPKQLLGKPYLFPFALRILSHLFSAFERLVCRRFDGIITATPFIRDKFLAINPNTLDVNNFPLIGELDSAVPWQDKRQEICYVGGIGSIRGIREIVHACGHTESDVRLNLVGTFSEPAVYEELKRLPEWGRVQEHGFLDRRGVAAILSRSFAGLVTFHPLPNHVDAQPNKMFEYMSSGIPVIASDFPLWREIIEGNQCGLCVPPLDPKAIAKAIDVLAGDMELARQMGENGRRAVLNRYNWGMEEKKLLGFYSSIVSKDTHA